MVSPGSRPASPAPRAGLVSPRYEDIVNSNVDLSRTVTCIYMFSTSFLLLLLAMNVNEDKHAFFNCVVLLRKVVQSPWMSRTLWRAELNVFWTQHGWDGWFPVSKVNHIAPQVFSAFLPSSSLSLSFLSFLHFSSSSGLHLLSLLSLAYMLIVRTSALLGEEKLEPGETTPFTRARHLHRLGETTNQKVFAKRGVRKEMAVLYFWASTSILQLL